MKTMTKYDYVRALIPALDAGQLFVRRERDEDGHLTMLIFTKSGSPQCIIGKNVNFC